MFSLRLQNGRYNVAGIDMRFVLQPGKFLVRNISQLGFGVSLLFLVERNRRRNLSECKNQGQYVDKYGLAPEVLGDLDRLVERSERIFVEVNWTKDRLVWESHTQTTSLQEGTASLQALLTHPSGIKTHTTIR